MPRGANSEYGRARERLIVALDFSSVDEARAMAAALNGYVGVYKIGMELIYAGGVELARELIDADERVFMDAKLLDIGNTVRQATSSVAALGAAYLTVHASDEKTLKAAVEGRGDSGLKLLAVTVMTNLDEADLRQQGVVGLTPPELAVKRARMAAECGFDGVITSGCEAAAIRAAIGPDMLIVTPGIRPEGAAVGDQSRVMTPAKALQASADALVIGRPITQSPNPAAAAADIVAEMKAAFA